MTRVSCGWEPLRTTKVERWLDAVEPIDIIEPDDPGSYYHCKRREIAIVMDRSASVRLWLERTGPRHRIVLEDLENGRRVSMTPADLLTLIESRRDDS